jgi:hypothetical protein
VTVTATVTNTGTMYGAGVVQVYLGFPAASLQRRPVGFEKIWLNPGQSGALLPSVSAPFFWSTMMLKPENLAARLDECMRRLASRARSWIPRQAGERPQKCADRACQARAGREAIE